MKMKMNGGGGGGGGGCCAGRDLLNWKSRSNFANHVTLPRSLPLADRIGQVGGVDLD